MVLVASLVFVTGFYKADRNCDLYGSLDLQLLVYRLVSFIRLALLRVSL